MLNIVTGMILMSRALLSKYRKMSRPQNPCHGHNLGFLSRALKKMSRPLFLVQNCHGHFCENCHGLPKKCHGKKKKTLGAQTHKTPLICACYREYNAAPAPNVCCPRKKVLLELTRPNQTYEPNLLETLILLTLQTISSFSILRLLRTNVSYFCYFPKFIFEHFLCKIE